MAILRAAMPAALLVRFAHRHRRAVAFVALLLPAAAPSQAQRSCPRGARVPGYGACSNIGGSHCGFCVYRCNDDTVVRWNVCRV